MANSIYYLRICSYWTHLGMLEYTEHLLVSASHVASNSHWEKQHSKYYIFIHTVIKLCLQIASSLILIICILLFAADSYIQFFCNFPLFFFFTPL